MNWLCTTTKQSFDKNELELVSKTSRMSYFKKSRSYMQNTIFETSYTSIKFFFAKWGFSRKKGLSFTASNPIFHAREKLRCKTNFFEKKVIKVAEKTQFRFSKFLTLKSIAKLEVNIVFEASKIVSYSKFKINDWECFIVNLKSLLKGD